MYDSKMIKLPHAADFVSNLFVPLFEAVSNSCTNRTIFSLENAFKELTYVCT